MVGENKISEEWGADPGATVLLGKNVSL
jgi:hypothetical protein